MNNEFCMVNSGKVLEDCIETSCYHRHVFIKIKFDDEKTLPVFRDEKSKLEYLFCSDKCANIFIANRNDKCEICNGTLSETFYPVRKYSDTKKKWVNICVCSIECFEVHKRNENEKNH